MCEETYREACETSYTTSYEQECETKYEETCQQTYETSYKQECTTTYEEVCQNVGYGYNTKQQCHKEPRQECHQVPVQVPRQACHQVPGKPNIKCSACYYYLTVMVQQYNNDKQMSAVVSVTFCITLEISTSNIEDKLQQTVKEVRIDNTR